ncbi:MAG: TetR/AcrR family transcriptional regulator [Spirochaetales bacterium]|nr:TetR/AcrR family transcriptional regulator [Spirochaetales bacterium]
MPREKKIPNPVDIIDAAFDIIDKDGYTAFSARKLAARLDVAHMTVYNYYSREYILGAVIRRGFIIIHKLIDNKIIKHIKQNNDPVGIYLIIADNLMQFAKDHPLLYRYMFQEESTGEINNPSLRRQYLSGSAILRRRIPQDIFDDFKNDSYLYILLINSLILSYIEERHGMDENTYDKNIKRSFEMILGQYRQKLRDAV